MTKADTRKEERQRASKSDFACGKGSFALMLFRDLSWWSIYTRRVTVMYLRAIGHAEQVIVDSARK
jgi:hypothetical protein